MAEQTATAEEPEQEHQESLWASFTRADMRLFLVTFAGTVAANILTVMLVAVAIILDRPSSGPRPTSTGMIILIFLALSLGIVVGIGVQTLRRAGPVDDGLGRLIRRSA